MKESGFDVLIAKNGKQAIKILEIAFPALVLLDVVMPEMDGFETCRYLKAWDKTKDIPVIFMTAIADFANPENKVKGLQLGGVDYISKPIQLDEVLARIKIHLHLRSLTQQLQEQNEKLKISEAKLAEAQRVAHVGNWEYDVLTQTMTGSAELFRIFGVDPTQSEPTLAEQLQFIHPDDRALWQQNVTQAIAKETSYQFDFRVIRPDLCIRYIEGKGEKIVNEQNQLIKLFGTALDITKRKQAEILLAGQNHILAAIASDVPLTEVLNALTKLVESQSGQMRCSFLLLDDEGRVHVGAAPNLPATYNQAVDGVKMNPNLGSCGAAIHRKTTVIVEDIASDPLWTDCRDLALSHGLRACWSTPIMATDGTVLGTFAGYYTEPRTVPNLDQDLIAQTLYLAKIAIERQRSQTYLRQSKERLQLALEGSDLGLWDWNIATEEVYFDPQWKQILGYGVDEIENKYQSWIELIHPEDLPNVMTILNAYLDRRLPVYDAEYRMRSKSGEWKWILVRGKVFERDEAGKPLRMAGTHKDISDRKLAEEALKQSEAREREKAQALEFTLEELKRTQAHLIQTEKMSSLGQMVAGVAHEINNPTSFIYGNLTYAREYFQELLELLQLYQNTYPTPTGEIQQLASSIDLPFLVEDWQSLMKSMQIGAERIQEIVRSLRSFSRLDESELKQVDIHEGIDNTLLILQHRLRAVGDQPEITVIKDYGQLPPVTCYSSQLNQVFMNLLSNAIDALQENSVQISQSQVNPTITIRTEMQIQKFHHSMSQFVAITIADNGCGMSQEVLHQIFDPFFTTKPVGSGTGVGLSISHQIVIEKHKGEISCTSMIGQGTEFIVKIPVRHHELRSSLT